ncbi:MAG TPA: tetratricopeptide repeat protein [Deltaproteobacteria bacterium]|nr:tetratricopeptide repeat protein [Deltaproteobacteria bacterium]
MKRGTLYLGMLWAPVVFLAMGLCTFLDHRLHVMAQNTPSEPATQVSAAACRQCHAGFFDQWSGSAHGSAARPYSKELAQRTLNAHKGTITIGGVTYQAEVGGGTGRMVAKGQWPWETKEYPVEHVLGGGRVLFFLTPGARGRFLILPLAFEREKKAWIATSQSGVTHALVDADPKSSQLQVFSSTCYGCHVSQVSAPYDLKSDSYASMPKEPGIMCEACHGPVARHEETFRSTQGAAGRDLMLTSTRSLPAERVDALCGSCHGLVSPITASFVPGEPLFDHYDIAMLEHTGFSPDGRNLGDTLTYTSWLMSPCARSGRLHCLSCHTLGGAYRFAGRERANNACLPCHAAIVGNAAAHTHHSPSGPGGLCISCHMAKLGPGGRGNTDHSMLPPAPRASMAFRSPNACTACHKDRDNTWAEQQLGKWHATDYQTRVIARAQLIDAARKKDWSRFDEMLSAVTSRDRDEVHAASLIRLMNGYDDRRKVPALLAALKDRSPLVRSAAAQGLGGVLDKGVIGQLAAAAGDPVRLVRIRSASSLAGAGKTALQPEQAQALARASGEYLSSLAVRQDDWTSHMGMGAYFLGQGDADNALIAFAAASKMNPRAVQPYVSASIAQAALGRLEKAELALSKALSLEPDNAAALYNMGLLRNDQGRTAEAEQYMKKALERDPNLAGAAYNLGVILSKDRITDAVHWARIAHRVQPVEKHGFLLATLLKKGGDWKEAVEVLEGLISSYPLNGEAYLLLGEIYEKQGRVGNARDLYRRGMAMKEMNERDRTRMEVRLDRLR